MPFTLPRPTPLFRVAPGLFSASEPITSNLLTVRPSALFFNTVAAQAIVNQSQAQSLVEQPNSLGGPVGLQVPTGQTLALVGGNVAVSGGNLTAAGGRIELGSVAGVGDVSLSQNGNNLLLNYDSINTFGNINLEDQAFIDVSGAGGGSLQVQGAQLQLSEGARIYADTYGTETGKEVLLHTTDAIALKGSSEITADVAPTGIGTGGNVTVETGQLSIQDGSRIRAGTLGKGQGGILAVSASDSIELVGTGTSLEKRTVPSGLFTESQGAGDAGILTITTKFLNVQDGARISTSTLGEGRGGTLTVNASESVKLSRSGSLLATFTTGTRGAKPAGDLTLITGNLIIQDGALISTSTLGEGLGGNLTVDASNSVELMGNSGLFTLTNGVGNAGNLRIATEQLSIQDGAEVSVSSRGSGRAGNLEVATRSIRLENQALLSADTRAGQGNIILNSQDVFLSGGSNITTNAIGIAEGGNIAIETDILVASENSDISANAQEAKGGRVMIDAQGIFGTQFRENETPESDITATSELGAEFSGTVEINTLYFDPSSALASLPVEVVDVSGLVAQGCPAEVGPNASSLIVTGRGGLPPNPTEALNSDTVLVDLGTPTQSEESYAKAAPAINLTKVAAPNQLVEAQGWVIGSNGEVVLTAAAPTVTPHNPWLTLANCHAPKTSS